MKLLLLACQLLLSLCVVYSMAASLPGMATRRRYTESNRLRGGVEPQQPLHVSVVSWNMAEKAPTEDACSFIKLHQSDDIVVFGIQECEDIRPRRNEGHRSRKWRSLQSRLLGRSFRCMARHKMGGLLIAVYVKKSVMKEVEGLQVVDVACGVGNVLSNKGALSVVLRIRDKTVAFINSHLAAHQKYVSYIVPLQVGHCIGNNRFVFTGEEAQCRLQPHHGSRTRKHRSGMDIIEARH